MRFARSVCDPPLLLFGSLLTPPGARWLCFPRSPEGLPSSLITPGISSNCAHECHAPSIWKRSIRLASNEQRRRLMLQWTQQVMSGEQLRAATISRAAWSSRPSPVRELDSPGGLRALLARDRRRPSPGLGEAPLGGPARLRASVTPSGTNAGLQGEQRTTTTAPEGGASVRVRASAAPESMQVAFACSDQQGLPVPV